MRYPSISFVVAALYVGITACSGQGSRGPSPPACAPTYLDISTTAEERRGQTTAASALLIGCKPDLEALTPAERVLLHNGVQEAAGELQFRLMRPNSPDVRHTITASLNRKLGRAIITDVYIYAATIADYAATE